MNLECYREGSLYAGRRDRSIGKLWVNHFILNFQRRYHTRKVQVLFIGVLISVLMSELISALMSGLMFELVLVSTMFRIENTAYSNTQIKAKLAIAITFARLSFRSVSCVDESVSGAAEANLG